MYINAYENLKKFVEISLDMYKVSVNIIFDSFIYAFQCLFFIQHELSTLLYPVLIYMYLELISNGNYEHAKVIIEKFGPEQEEYHQEDISKISLVTNQIQLNQNELTLAFK